MTALPLLSQILPVAEASATLAFALAGLLQAARKRLDPVGGCIIAGLAAFGGGTLRDIPLERRPPFWVEHAAWLWVRLGLCSAAMARLRVRHCAPTERAMQWPHALGLGLFGATGTQIALGQDLPAIVAVPVGAGHRGVRRRAARHRLQRGSERVPRPPAVCRVRVRRRLDAAARVAGRRPRMTSANPSQ